MNQLIHKFAAFLVACALLCINAGSSLAQEDVKVDAGELKKIQSNINEERKKAAELNKKSAEIEKELKKIQEELVVLASKIQDNERKMSSLEMELSQLEQDEQFKKDTLQAKEGELSKIIAAMVKLSRIPPEAVIAMPSEIEDIGKTSMVLTALVKSLKNQSESLKVDILEIRNLTNQISETKQKLVDEKENLKKNIAEQDVKMAERADLQKTIVADLKKREQTIEELSKKAENLKDLITSIEENRKIALKRAEFASNSQPEKSLKPLTNEDEQEISTEPQPKKHSKSNDWDGKYLSPVSSGKVIEDFGDSSDGNSSSKGIKFETRSKAQVIAPAAGEVIFTGPFRGYGKILIIRHNDTYHSLISGLKKISVSPGQNVASGEPVGTMGDDSDSLRKLYLEIRKNNKPVDPKEWLGNITTNKKADG